MQHMKLVETDVTFAGKESVAAAVTTQSLRLGRFVLDPNRSRLIDGDKVVRLKPKELSVLQHLIDQAPNVVSLEQLMLHSWPDVVVCDNTLHRAVSNLRGYFNDNPRNSGVIETVPRRGYRLMVEPCRAAPEPGMLSGESASTSKKTQWWTIERSAQLGAALAITVVAGWMALFAQQPDPLNHPQIVGTGLQTSSQSQPLDAPLEPFRVESLSVMVCR